VRRAIWFIRSGVSYSCSPTGQARAEPIPLPPLGLAFLSYRFEITPHTSTAAGACEVGGDSLDQVGRRRSGESDDRSKLLAKRRGGSVQADRDGFAKHRLRCRHRRPSSRMLQEGRTDLQSPGRSTFPSNTRGNSSLTRTAGVDDSVQSRSAKSNDSKRIVKLANELNN